MKPQSHPLVWTSLLLFLATGHAIAQTGPGLLIAPWQERDTIEVDSSVMILAGGRADPEADGEPNEDADIRIYDATGRLRLDPDGQRRLSAGFDFTYIDLGTNVTGYDHLVDQSVAVAFGLGRCEDWEIGAVVGVGYAGNNPFGDCSAWYAKANLIASTKFDENSGLQIILDYNGNRTIFPDLPLPAVAYWRKSSEQLRYTVGLPYSNITWTPTDTLTIDVDYAIPFNIDLKVTWQVLDQFAVFGGFHNRFDAFFIDDLERERRHFFRQRSVEAGVRWSPSRNIDVSLAGGFAFDQQIEVGFDARDTDTVAEFSDEPFVRLAAELRF